MTNPWKEAATVIILARSVFSNSHLKPNNVKHTVSPHVNYKILTVKRASKSSFMPNSYVFPGGLCHEADASRDWLELYRNMKIGTITYTYPFAHDKDAKELKVRANNVLSFDEKGNCLPKALTYRITAIRELFEESGVLLVKNSKIHQKTDLFSNDLASYLYSDEIIKWQEKVQKNPFEFIKLCKHFKCVPDVWSLKDWIFWLTPAHLPSKRFNTAFFVAAVNHIPPTKPDNKEISDLKWYTPDELLEKHKLQKLWLPPPQFYELSRIATNFENIEDFVNYSSRWYGCDRWMPVAVKADDGWVYFLPGDEMYPNAPDFLNMGADKKNEEPVKGVKMIDLREKCSRLHRLEIQSPHNFKIIINNLPHEDHVYPHFIEAKL